MRTGGAAADAGGADNLAALHPCTGNGGERQKVSCPGWYAKSVIDYNQAAVTCMVFRDGNDSIGCGVHRRAVIGGDVDARMEGALTAERIQAFAKAVCDMTKDRPDRWSVGRVRETHRRHQPQATAGDGDHRGIAL